MNLSKFTILASESFFVAMKKIEANKKGFLIVIDATKKVLGTITDGDIRRAFINGKVFEDDIQESFSKVSVIVNEADDFNVILESFKNPKIQFIPIVDNNGCLCNLITKKNMHSLLLQDKNFDLKYDFLSIDDSILEHEIYPRPWGLYKTTFLNDYSQSKIIKVLPGGTLSLQEHKKREEYWVIINGIGEVVLGESIKRVESGDFVYVPKGCKHRLKNISKDINLMIAEVQLGEYFGEDDIIRYDDIYGRE